ncbi:MAG: class I SAM-dependent methyltransferase [Chloroflexota bacterium]
MYDYYSSPDLYEATSGKYADDLAYYTDLAVNADGLVLELACGTGRVLIPIAESGVQIWGLDASDTMLARASSKVDQLPTEVRQRITLQQGNMVDFKIDQRFKLIMIPFRSFLHVMTVKEQLEALVNFHTHLEESGLLALNFFQPSLSLISSQSRPTKENPKLIHQWTDPITNHQWSSKSAVKHLISEQVIEEYRVFEEVDEQGKLLNKIERNMTLRWIYRFEFEHLLARAGFAVVSLYGDFERTPFGPDSNELVWIARKM